MRYFTLLLLLTTIGSYAQKKNKKILMETVNPHIIEWSEGSILTTDDEELKGLIKYNNKTGVLNYEYGNDSRSMTPRSVVAFEFYDADQKKQRLFYSMEYEERFHFFELLYDFVEFAIISKTDPADIDFSQPNLYTDHFNNNVPSNKVTASVSQVETICFLNPSGEITPYLTIENIEKEGIWFDHNRNKNKMMDRDLLAEHLGPDYDEVKMYIKENDLNMKKKDDLMKVFEYYSRIKG